MGVCFFGGITKHLVLWLAHTAAQTLPSSLRLLPLLFQAFSKLLLPFSFHKYSPLAQNQLLVWTKKRSQHFWDFLITHTHTTSLLVWHSGILTHSHCTNTRTDTFTHHNSIWMKTGNVKLQTWATFFVDWWVLSICKHWLSSLIGGWTFIEVTHICLESHSAMSAWSNVWRAPVADTQLFGWAFTASPTLEAFCHRCQTGVSRSL